MYKNSVTRVKIKKPNMTWLIALTSLYIIPDPGDNHETSNIKKKVFWGKIWSSNASNAFLKKQKESGIAPKVK